MKAIYAGLVADVDLALIRYYQYNCTKEQLAPLYYIPVNKFSDVQVYINFGPVKPLDTIIIQLLGLCGVYIDRDITPCHYMVGIDPDGNYYGIFQFADGALPNQFALAFTVEMADTTTRVYFTEGYQLETCVAALKVEACFPNLQTDLGFDDNGIYFGDSMDDSDSFGNTALRYQHYAFVRKAKVFEESPKATFSSNIRRNFKTVLERIYELRTELVPTWYKNYLQAIYVRGFIKVSGETYRVTDLSIEPVADDDHTWKPNCKLKIETHHYYGCADETCSTDCCSPCDVSATVETFCCSPEITGASAEELIDAVFDFDGNTVEGCTGATVQGRVLINGTPYTGGASPINLPPGNYNIQARAIFTQANPVPSSCLGSNVEVWKDGLGGTLLSTADSTGSPTTVDGAVYVLTVAPSESVSLYINIQAD